MADFSVRSDSVDVEQIMEQIRARIREKRGVDYTEQQIHDLAAVKLETFLDPEGLRSDLLDQFRRLQREPEPPVVPSFTFEDTTIYETHRGVLRWIRSLLNPLLKLFFNPNSIISALHTQAEINRLTLERELAREKQRRDRDALYFEIIHNLVLEVTRLGIEAKNLKMRVESLSSRLEFNERRARALESVVAYKPSPGNGPKTVPVADAPVPRASNVTIVSAPAASSASPASQPGAAPEGPGQKSRRRRRRRGRRGGAPAAQLLGTPERPPGDPSHGEGAPGEESAEGDDGPSHPIPDVSAPEPPAVDELFPGRVESDEDAGRDRTSKADSGSSNER